MISDGQWRCDLLMHSRFTWGTVSAKPRRAPACVAKQHSLLGSRSPEPFAQDPERLYKNVMTMLQESRELANAVGRVAAALQWEPRPASRPLTLTFAESSLSGEADRMSEDALQLPERAHRGSNAPGRVQVGTAEQEVSC